tara:strand:- start:2482 stop:2685 length:204 start_codon:yes stop_codon:yes gene_type:complete
MAYRFKVHKIVRKTSDDDEIITFKVVESPYYNYVGKMYNEDEWQSLLNNYHIGTIIKSSTMYILKEK